MGQVGKIGVVVRWWGGCTEGRRTANDISLASAFTAAEGPWSIGCRSFLGQHLDSIDTATSVTFSILSLLSTIVHSPARKTWRGTLFLTFCLGEARFEQQGWLAAAADWIKDGGSDGTDQGLGERAEQLEARGFL